MREGTIPAVGNQARVLVIEDDDPIRHALRAALRGEGYEVQADAHGVVIRATLDTFRPDLAILDVRLEEGPSGFTTARTIRSIQDIPVLFLTAADSVEDRLEGFSSGGEDYVVKPFAMTELLARVRALLRRSGRVVSEVWRADDLVVDQRGRTVRRGGAQIELTKTEFDLLAALVRHRGQLLSKNQLLHLVWGFDAYAENLVEVHISSLRRKIEVHGPRLIHTVRAVGYTLRV